MHEIKNKIQKRREKKHQHTHYTVVIQQNGRKAQVNPSMAL